MTPRRKLVQIVFSRTYRILLSAACCLTIFACGLHCAAGTPQTAQQQQQQREEQQREQQQRQQEQREAQQRQQEQREEQQREQQQQREEQQREQQQRAQEQQREEQQRQQQEQQQREAQQREQQQREAQQREQQQREDQQRVQQQRDQQQRQEQQREQQQQRQPSNPVLRTRPIDPAPITSPARNLEIPQSRPSALDSRNSSGLHPSGPPALPAAHGREPASSTLPRLPEAGSRGPLLASPMGLQPAGQHPALGVTASRGSMAEAVDPLKLSPPRPRLGRPEPVAILPRHRPAVAAPSTAVILALGPAPRPAIAGAALVPSGPQTLLQVQARVQAAQVGCAQADAYQARVDALVNSQNNLSQGINQIMQTVADNTTNPDIQNALLDAIGQPNPINDTLGQQLEALASTYESTCQARLSAAQAALPVGSSQQAAQSQDDGQASASDQGDQNGTDALVDSPIAPPLPPPDARPLVGCPAVAAGSLPQPRGPWGPWGVAGSSGLVFDVSRVNATTVTWRFLNAGSSTIAAMQFSYSYVDAGSGQNATQNDVLPYPLAPGQSAGGWAAYSANTRGDIKLAITQVLCQ